jgi:hypothetical protein
MEFVVRAGLKQSSRPTDIFAMTDLDDADSTWRSDDINDSPITDPEASGSFVAVTQRFFELQGMQGQFLFDGFFDFSLNSFGTFWDVFSDNAFHIFDFVCHDQALSWGILLWGSSRLPSAILEK